MGNHCKKLSCGVIVEDNQDRILACHPTGKSFEKGNYDIPKGLREEKDNSEIDTAVRELYEETGIQIPDNNMLTDLGIFEYLKDKDLHLFYIKINNDFENIGPFFCESKFIDSHDNYLPEVNRYKFVDKEELDWFFKSLQPVLEEAFNILEYNEYMENFIGSEFKYQGGYTDA